jgi:hypothetical protein
MLIEKTYNKFDFNKIKGRSYNLKKDFTIPINLGNKFSFRSKINGLQIKLPTINVMVNQTYYLVNKNFDLNKFNVVYGLNKVIELTNSKPLLFIYDGVNWVLKSGLENIEIPIQLNNDVDLNLGVNEVVENVVIPKLIKKSIPKIFDFEKIRLKPKKDEFNFRINFKDIKNGSLEYYNVFSDKLFNRGSIFYNNSFLELKFYITNDVNRTTLIDFKRYKFNLNVLGDEIIIKVNKPNTNKVNINSNQYYLYYFNDDFKSSNEIKLYVTCEFFNAKSGKMVLLTNNNSGEIYDSGILNKNYLFTDVILNKKHSGYEFKFNVDVDGIIDLYEVK